MLTSDKSPSSTYIVSERNTYELPKLGYTVGIDVCYLFSKHVSFETGINYINKGYRTQYYSNFISPMPNDPYIPQKIKYDFNYHCIALPLQFNFIGGTKKIRFIGGAGLIINTFLYRQAIETSVYTDSTVITHSRAQNGFNTLNISALLSCGIDMKLNSKLNFRALPFYRFDLDVFQTSPIKEHLWCSGINVGLYYKL
jgi:hypothetical protein